MKQQTSSAESLAGSVPAEFYTTEYYLSEVSGWQEYLESGGMALVRE